MGPINRDFRQKKNILILPTQKNKKTNFMCQDCVGFTLSLDESINLLYSL